MGRQPKKVNFWKLSPFVPPDGDLWCRCADRRHRSEGSELPGRNRGFARSQTVPVSHPWRSLGEPHWGTNCDVQHQLPNFRIRRCQRQQFRKSEGRTEPDTEYQQSFPIISMGTRRSETSWKHLYWIVLGETSTQLYDKFEGFAPSAVFGYYIDMAGFCITWLQGCDTSDWHQLTTSSWRRSSFSLGRVKYVTPFLCADGDSDVDNDDTDNSSHTCKTW